MALQRLNLVQPEKRSISIAAPNPLENPTVPLTSHAAWEFLGGGWGQTASSETVNEITAMHSATVNACVTLISSSIASMSPILYQRQGAGRSEAFSNPLHRLLSLEPNPESSAFSLWFRLMSNILLTGRGFIQIQRDSEGNPVSLWGLDSRCVTIVRHDDGTLAFRSSEGLGQDSSNLIESSDMIYVPWHIAHDGVTGLSSIQLARAATGVELAMQRYEGQFYANNATPTGILTVPTGTKVKPEDKTLMKQDWQELNGGVNRRGVAILDNGLVFTPLAISQADSEFLASKSYTRESLCGLFGLAASQIGSESRVAGETFSQQSLNYLIFCLRPWINKVGQELSRKLIPRFSGLKIEHDVSDLLKVDFASQMAGYALGKQWGWYSTNDIREKLSENPIGPEGDIYLQPLNMFDAAKPTAPAPTPTTTTSEVSSK